MSRPELPPLMFAIENETFQHIQTIVGHLVIAFGQIEFNLDVTTATAHAKGGNALLKKLPVQFSERTKFIAECANRLAVFAAYRDRLKRIASEGDRLAKIRNDIVHGYLAQYEEHERHLLTFVKTEVDKTTRKRRVIILRKITAEELAQAAIDATDIADDLATVNMQLLDLPIPKRPGP